MDPYDFKAPMFQDVPTALLETCEPKKQEDQSPVKVPVEEESKQITPAKPTPTEEPETEQKPDSPTIEEKEVSRRKSSMKSVARKLSGEGSTRSSPRLVARSRAARRENASRGLLNQSRRRSVSENGLSAKLSTIGRKTHVIKKSTIQKGLSHTNTSQLSEVATISKRLNDNRKRSNQKKPSGPTRPQDFHFATDARFGPKKMEPPAAPASKTSRPSYESSTKGVTKPQPFHLHEGRKNAEQPKKFVSMAELNIKLQTKTPDRFRSTRSKAPEVAKWEPKATIPHTPRLSSNKRSRPVDYPTQEEKERSELEEAQKHKFKAQPLNKKALGTPTLPVIPRKKLTLPEPFEITDETNRVVTEKSEADLVEMYGSTSSLASCTHKGVDKKIRPRVTDVKPFSFDTRDMEALRKKKEKIEKEIEEEKRLAEFHAHPMPKFGEKPKGLPSKKAKTPVKVAAFPMHSDQRGTAKQQMIKQQLQQEEEEAKQKRHFVAREPVSIRKEPFIPEKPRRHLADISHHELNTADRAKQREHFNMQLKEKEYELQALKKAREERQKMEEESEIKRMRQEAQHKAKPVPAYKPFEVKQGLLPVTLPQTPQFATSRRLRNNTVSSETFSSE